VEAPARAGAKKNAQRRGQTIVFVDESGLSERPHRVRTWAPRGQTPVLRFHFNWKTLSVMAGITWWNFYFKLFPGAINSLRTFPATIVPEESLIPKVTFVT
jgi:hypothetical protein